MYLYTFRNRTRRTGVRKYPIPKAATSGFIVIKLFRRYLRRIRQSTTGGTAVEKFASATRF